MNYHLKLPETIETEIKKPIQIQLPKPTLTRQTNRPKCCSPFVIIQFIMSPKKQKQ
jgi:hypothetical protein